MTRRGFTLLEVMLASLIGAMVMALCAMLLFSGNRTEVMLAARAEQTADLGRIRVVLQRTFSSLLMVKLKQENRTAATKPGTGSVPGAKTPSDESPLTPRLRLEGDPDLLGLFMAPRSLTISTPSVHPQRLEVVLTDSPVPQSDTGEAALRSLGVRSRLGQRAKKPSAAAEASNPESSGGDGASGVNGATPDAQSTQLADESQTTVRAVRGAFEFWPEQLESERGVRDALGSFNPDGETPVLWEMWWVPLPPRGEHVDDADPPQVLPLGRPYLIAKNIRFARWVAFKDREHKVVLDASIPKDLPAYVEFQVETAAGLRSEWMFEIGWAMGPEAPSPPVPAPTGPSRAASGTSAADATPLRDPTVVGSKATSQKGGK